MNDEVRKAAERYRTWEHGAQEYMPPMVGVCRYSDMETLANAYLAEHPADDDEPVTEEWWDNTLGGRHVCIQYSNFGLWLDTRYGNVKVELYAESAALDSDCFVLTLLVKPTRGDVRRLCRALGIEPKEQA